MHLRDLLEQKLHLAVDVRKDGLDQILLALEMLIGRGAGEIAGRRHAAQGEIGDAVALQFDDAGRDQLLAYR